MKRLAAMLSLFAVLGLGACFGGQGLKPGDLAPGFSGQAVAEPPVALRGPAVLVFLRGFG